MTGQFSNHCRLKRELTEVAGVGRMGSVPLVNGGKMAATLEDVIDVINKSGLEFDRRMKESELQMAAYREERAESARALDKRMAETAEQMAETDRRIEKLTFVILPVLHEVLTQEGTLYQQ